MPDSNKHTVPSPSATPPACDPSAPQSLSDRKGAADKRAAKKPSAASSIQNSLSERTADQQPAITTNNTIDNSIVDDSATPGCATNFTADASVARHYLDINGQRQNISVHTRQYLIQAIGDAGDPQAPLPPVHVFTSGSPLTLTPAGTGHYHWTLISEQGVHSEGDCQGGKAFSLPASLAEGYHQLTLQSPAAISSAIYSSSSTSSLSSSAPAMAALSWQCRIIIAPARCYQPVALANKQKLWGACVQLYTLKSLNNWGIGDFGDLQKLVRETAHYGAAFIGLNPLHALYPALPDRASPYSPSSRQWLNIIYIDVNAVEDFQINPEAEAWWLQSTTQQRLDDARNADWVDYAAVMALKMEALTIAWRKFTTRKHSDNLVRQYQRFVEKGGDSLYWHAVYHALHCWLSQQNPDQQHPEQWPACYQHTQSSKVSEFCRHHTNDIQFHCWLQWLAQRQLTACWQACQKTAMPVGLYRDLAVGVSRYSADTWHDPTLYSLTIDTGAPPDPLGPQGQNWQLPPFNPQQLIHRAYQPFIDLLRANMRSCGALRIDHVMGLMRLWWIPANDNASQGAYVHYPLDDLLAILALESQRQQCLIIGEDLGIVPAGLREKLHNHGIHSYKVLYFERDAQHSLPAPEQWPAQALATLNTHDLPTLQAYWRADDLQLAENLHLYPDTATVNNLRQQRQQQKHTIIDALIHHQCLPARTSNEANRNAASPLLLRALYRYLATCQSALVGIQPEDWLDLILPVNVPGTDQQYPNWRRKLNRPLDEIFISSTITRLFTTLNKYRKQASKKAK